MNQYDIASRSIYLLAQAVNYSCEDEVKAGERNLQTRIEKANVILGQLEEWKQNLSVHFRPLPIQKDDFGTVFYPIWINPPALGAAIQMYSFARVLLLVHQPAAGGFREWSGRESQIAEAINTICGIAMTIEEDASLITSTQCVFGAGLYTQEGDKKEAIVEILNAHQSHTGWPVASLAEELRAEWAKKYS